MCPVPGLGVERQSEVRGVEPERLDQDRVVTAGVSRIYDGLEVRVPNTPGSEPDNVAPDVPADAASAEGDEPQ